MQHWRLTGFAWVHRVFACGGAEFVGWVGIVDAVGDAIAVARETVQAVKAASNSSGLATSTRSSWTPKRAPVLYSTEATLVRLARRSEIGHVVHDEPAEGSTGE